MISGKQRAALGILAISAALAGISAGQSFPWQTGENQAQRKTVSAVQFVGPEQVEVAAGRPQELVLRFHVANGFHINSHTPREKSLIPTQLMVVEEGGVRTTAVDFPPGADFRPSFAPDQALSVYAGDFSLRAHITAQPGSQLLQGSLRYQACDANACMPPRNIPVAVSVLAK